MKKVIPNFIKPGKINMIIDGSFGSTGKGLIASRIALDNDLDMAISTLSPNAGHTFYVNGVKKITKLFPVTGIMNDKSLIFFAASSVIDVDLFFNEMERFNIDSKRVLIHPRAAIISDTNTDDEKKVGGVERIASTQSGTGSARASKIMRTNILAERVDAFKKMISIPNFHYILGKAGMKIIVETGQGIDLGLNHGFSYPFVTSRDVLPSNILGDLGVHPMFMGNSMLTFRTYPIRVGNILRDGIKIGDSGPFWDDQEELTWDELNVQPELTTVTGRVRRVATFSIKQYINSINLVRPTHIFMNFVNYLRSDHFEMMSNLKPQPDFIGMGPLPEDVKKNGFRYYFYKRS